MKKTENVIVVFPKVKDYDTIKYEDIIWEEAKIVGKFVESECIECGFSVNFIGELDEINEPVPIGLVSIEHSKMILITKAELSISGSKAIVKWNKIERNKNISEYAFFPLIPNRYAYPPREDVCYGGVGLGLRPLLSANYHQIKTCCFS